MNKIAFTIKVLYLIIAITNNTLNEEIFEETHLNQNLKKEKEKKKIQFNFVPDVLLGLS